MFSIEALYQEWAASTLGRDRARGGRAALGGFLFQVYVTLDRFFEHVIDGRHEAQHAFDGLSDLAEWRGDLLYLTQIKTTLDSRSLRAAIEEALTVWQFLGEQHPELRSRVRFQLACRRQSQSLPRNIGSMSSEELGIDEGNWEGWNEARQQFLPAMVCGSPRLDLAIRLWRHSRHCFTLIDACVAKMFALLGENRPSTDVSEALLELWDTARSGERPPGQLYGPKEMMVLEPYHECILHGVRPRPSDLRQGAFMERLEVLGNVVDVIRSAIRQCHGSKSGKIPVCWITGPSGAGKSVLLLQAMRELVCSGDVEVANYLGEISQYLPRSLDYWLHGCTRAAVVVDDIFAPDNRDAGLWKDVAEVLFSADTGSGTCILTCGPYEQLKSFKREIHRHSELEVFEAFVKPMGPEEMSRFHGWYVQKTGSNVPRSNETIVVAAAWVYELRRKVNLAPDAFALRFRARLLELGIEEVALAALALNQYGMSAPSSLFDGCEDQIEVLAREGVFRFSRCDGERRGGHFFHPRISRVIYNSLVEQGEVWKRARHLALGFDAMQGEEDAASGFLGWLGSSTTQPEMSTELKRRVVRELWPIVGSPKAEARATRLLLRWHEIAVALGVSLESLGVEAVIRRELTGMSTADPRTGVYLEILWDEGDARTWSGLLSIGLAVLRECPGHEDWAGLWQRLWTQYRMLPELVSIGTDWLLTYPSSPGWPRVWERMVDSGVRKPELLAAGLAAVPEQQAFRDDLSLSERFALFGVEPATIASNLVRQLAKVRSSGKMKRGVGFLVRQCGASAASEVLEPALRACVEEESWPYLWVELSRGVLGGHVHARVGLDWLKGREDRPCWGLVWRRLVEMKCDRDEVLSQGRAWLIGREDNAGWARTWEVLVDEEFDVATVLPMGRDWLSGREDRLEWSFVWRYLIRAKCDVERMLSVGREWLSDREQRPDWALVWRQLVDVGYDTNGLIPVGMEWLDGRENRPEWAHVWACLVEVGAEHGRLLAAGWQWLKGREGMAEWSHVWRKLLKAGYEVTRLLPIGRDWLIGREDTSAWSHVWELLAENGFDRERVLDMGLKWLVGRKDRVGWSHVWRALMKSGFERDEIAALGRDWLVGREDRPDWSHVWRTLILVGVAPLETFVIGRDWLVGREDRSDWSHVWRQLVGVGLDRERLLPIGRSWLAGREKRAEWGFVWRALVDCGFERKSMLQMGRRWLPEHRGNPSYGSVCEVVGSGSNRGRGPGSGSRGHSRA